MQASGPKGRRLSTPATLTDRALLGAPFGQPPRATLGALGDPPEDSAAESEPVDDPERFRRAWPVLIQKALARGFEHNSENEGDEDRVIELPRDRDEVRNDVDRHGEVRGQSPEQKFVPSPDLPVTHQSLHEHDAP